MTGSRFFKFVAPTLALVIVTACDESNPVIIGQLQSERVELIAESNEPIIAIHTTEGDDLAAGDPVMTQDQSRLRLQLLEMQGHIAGIEAQLNEQLNGPRTETIEAARLLLTDAEAESAFRQAELARLMQLKDRNLTSAESVDLAVRQREAADSAVAVARVRLLELENGTRPEQIELTRQTLAQAQARLQALELDLQRLAMTAPVNGIVDSLPFEVGERPRIGDVVAVMLTGSQPLARVYVPETIRLAVHVGDQVRVAIDGQEDNLTGQVLRIGNEASFTPYFALTERERGRLSFVAEITLPDSGPRLPEGMPVEVILDSYPGDGNE